MTTQRGMEIDYLEAQELVENEWAEFLEEWLGLRGKQQQVEIPAEESDGLEI